jgi:ribosomal subunit interface protein
MEIKFTFRHMEHSSIMEEYIRGQLAKIEEYLKHEREPIFIEIVLEPAKVHAHHMVEIRVKTPRCHLISTYEGSQFYDVVDRVLDVMYRQILEKKRELVHDKKQGE